MPFQSWTKITQKFVVDEDKVKSGWIIIFVCYSIIMINILSSKCHPRWAFVRLRLFFVCDQCDRRNPILVIAFGDVIGDTIPDTIWAVVLLLPHSITGSFCVRMAEKLRRHYIKQPSWWQMHCVRDDYVFKSCGFG